MTQTQQAGVIKASLDPAEAPQRAAQRFLDGLSCTEAIVETTCGLIGVSPAYHVRMATGFRAGMARSGCSCGALVGAIMAGGLLTGRDDETQDESAALALSRRLHDRFKATYGSTCCRVLNGDDFESPEHDARCAEITGTSMRMLVEEVSAQGSAV